MNGPMTANGFEHVINVININLFSYLAPKDLFHLSCANKSCEKVVGEHLFETCRSQLEIPVKQGRQGCRLDLAGGLCNLKFSRGRTFHTKAELLDFVCAKWSPTATILDDLPIECAPNLAKQEELKELKTHFSHQFFNVDRPYMSSARGDGVLLSTTCDFMHKLRIDSSGIRSDGCLPKFSSRRYPMLSILPNSYEMEFIENWTGYLMASNTVTVDCWGWAIKHRDGHYVTLSWDMNHFGFSCVFSKREGGKEIELFADVQSVKVLKY